MAYTKKQLIDLALEEIGVASYDFDVQPEEYQSALRKLDALLASWNGKGIRIGYPIPSKPEDSSLDQDSNLPDVANEAVYTNLALRLAPSYGRTVSVDTRISARKSYNTLLAKYTEIPSIQYPSTLPRGQGNRQRGGSELWNKYYGEQDKIEVGKDGFLEY